MLYLVIVFYLCAENNDLEDQSRAEWSYFPPDITYYT